MERRSFLKGLFAAAAVAAGCAARPPGAEAAPLPARPTPPVEPKVAEPAVAEDADIAAAKVEKAQYYVVRRRWRPAPANRCSSASKAWSAAAPGSVAKWRNWARPSVAASARP